MIDNHFAENEVLWKLVEKELEKVNNGNEPYLNRVIGAVVLLHDKKKIRLRAFLISYIGEFKSIVFEKNKFFLKYSTKKKYLTNIR